MLVEQATGEAVGVVDAAFSQCRAQRFAVRGEVERCARFPALHTGCGEPFVDGQGDAFVQSAAGGDMRGDLRRLVEGGCGGLLHGCGAVGPEFGCDANNLVPHLSAQVVVQEASAADPPAAQRRVLGQSPR